MHELRAEHKLDSSFVFYTTADILEAIMSVRILQQLALMALQQYILNISAIMAFST
jgi:hypothetical protein